MNTDGAKSMKAGWMADVLADMEEFAEINGMNELRLHLARCREIAIETEGAQVTLHRPVADTLTVL